MILTSHGEALQGLHNNKFPVYQVKLLCIISDLSLNKWIHTHRCFPKDCWHHELFECTWTFSLSSSHPESCWRPQSLWNIGKKREKHCSKYVYLKDTKSCLPNIPEGGSRPGLQVLPLGQEFPMPHVWQWPLSSLHLASHSAVGAAWGMWPQTRALASLLTACSVNIQHLLISGTL